MDSVRDERTDHNPDQEVDTTDQLIEEVRLGDRCLPRRYEILSDIADAILDAGDPNGSIPAGMRGGNGRIFRSTCGGQVGSDRSKLTIAAPRELG